MGTATNKTVRMTVPPAQPLDPQPIVRGAMPTSGQWQPSVRLEPPVALAPALPRIPAYVPDTEVRLGQPRP
jgi:hypothetical protein